MNIAYIRVSTVEQNEARQVEAMKQYNIDKVYQEKEIQSMLQTSQD
ncbi:recombinase family protein [Bacillus albus]